MEFRLNSDKYNYVRIVFSFYEWIGSIGGGLFVIKAFFSYIMGDLLLFNCMIECMSELYTNEKSNKENDHKLETIDKTAVDSSSASKDHFFTKMRQSITAKLKEQIDENSDDFTNFNIKPCNRFYIYILQELYCFECCGTCLGKKTR